MIFAVTLKNLTIMTQQVDTFFAPAERTEPDTIKKQRQVFLDREELRLFLDFMPSLVFVLNECRQIVYANARVYKTLALRCNDLDHAPRPGEAVNCKYVPDAPGGCGTSEHCQICGAVRAILESDSGVESVQTCNLTNQDGDDFTFRTTASMLELEGFKFTVFSLDDISDKERRKNLERIFFHDILNTAGGIQSTSELLMDELEVDRDFYLNAIRANSTKLVDEIKAQRLLLAAENDELKVQPSRILPKALLQDVKESYETQDVARNKTIEFEDYSGENQIYSDPVLLRRIIGNMLKNALEAVEGGKTVTMRSSCSGGRFSV